MVRAQIAIALILAVPLACTDAENSVTRATESSKVRFVNASSSDMYAVRLTFQPGGTSASFGTVRAGQQSNLVGISAVYSSFTAVATIDGNDQTTGYSDPDAGEPLPAGTYVFDADYVAGLGMTVTRRQ